MDIIGLVIVIAIIKSLLRKEKETNKRRQDKEQSGEQWKQMVFDFVDKAESYAKKRSEDMPYSSTRRTDTYAERSRTRATSAGNAVYNQVQQQRATKARLQEKYGSTQPSYAKTATKTDILSRAKGNVQEEAPNAFKQEAHAAVCSEYRSHAEASPNLEEHRGHSPECDFDAESDILKRVNDLIVMGYDGSMEFDRDFIAEGVDMLNSFSL